MNFILNALMRAFSTDLAIDLGTANTLVYVKDKGIVINEPSVVAIRTGNNSKSPILAVGLEAKNMLGKAPDHIRVIRPMRDGVIADFEVTGAMLRHFIRKVHNRRLFARPRIVLIQESMAAAIGAGLPVTEPTCNMVVDIGGGTTEVAIISLAGVVYSKTIRVAGDQMDSAIIQHIRRHYNLLIGERTAENVKISIGNAYPDLQNLGKVETKGRDLASGIPKILSIDSEEIRVAISEQVDAIIETVKAVLEQIPPEFSADIIERGMILTGGGALLKNLDKILAEETGVPITIIEDPLSSVAIGAGRVTENIELLKKVTPE
jgi:rod shape-determining protein MreB